MADEVRNKNHTGPNDEPKTNDDDGLDNRKVRPENRIRLFEQLPCKICGDRSSGFHYGVMTCEGCKVIHKLEIVES